MSHPTRQSLEEQIAHLTRAVDELSDIVARQDADIERLKNHTTLLIEREAGRERDGGGGIVLGDERPPHY